MGRLGGHVTRQGPWQQHRVLAIPAGVTCCTDGCQNTVACMQRVMKAPMLGIHSLHHSGLPRGLASGAALMSAEQNKGMYGACTYLSAGHGS